MDSSPPTSAKPRAVGPLLMVWAVAVLACGLVVALRAAFGGQNSITEVFLYEQDAKALAMCGVFWLLADAFATRAPWPIPVPAASWRRAVGIGLAVAALALIGSRLVFRNYGLSMDEFMATFDATIFRGGRLLAPLPAEWQGYADALQPIFRLPVAGGEAWSSSYLPMNAAFLGLLRAPGFPSAASALWACVAIIALFGIARRLWPDRPTVALVPVLLLASSTQFIITAMTPYAMTAHLALNLVWLWLFLRGDRLGHGLAAGVAFVACGLHQVIFHPLFAAPFVAQLWLERRWRTALFHTAAYAAIGLFWVLYFSLALTWSGASGAASQAVGAGDFVGRVLALLGGFHFGGGVALMAKNMLRFIAWQNVIAGALFLVGVIPALKAGGVLRALVLGIALTILAMFVLLPFQGHGWGYRYLHGLLGGASLVATLGLLRLWDTEPARQAGLARLFAAACLFSWLVILPWYGFKAHQWVTPYARATEAIERMDADVVLVDERGVWYGQDLVRNDPWLRTRPKVLRLASLDIPRVQRLCRQGSVRVFDRADAQAAGMRLYPGDGPWGERAATLRAEMARLSCGTRP